jgi:hypothetical protein
MKETDDEDSDTSGATPAVKEVKVVLNAAQLKVIRSMSSNHYWYEIYSRILYLKFTTHPIGQDHNYPSTNTGMNISPNCIQGV